MSSESAATGSQYEPNDKRTAAGDQDIEEHGALLRTDQLVGALQWHWVWERDASSTNQLVSGRDACRSPNSDGQVHITEFGPADSVNSMTP